MTASGFRVVIPSRLGSTRLPNKPLLDVAGKPLVVRCLDVARRAGADEVLVATDDERIADVVRAAGGDVQLTRADHPSGTDRLAEVARARGWTDDAIVVNLQGDEPLVPSELLAELAQQLVDHPGAGIATMATPILTHEELHSPNAVKVALRDDGFAHYFSRAPIPFARDADRRSTTLPEGVRYLRHLGLYAYRVATLHQFVALGPHPHERAEQLEQLRPLAAGVGIHVRVLDSAPPPGVDTAEDLERAAAVFRGAP
ncbi:MAG: 3-deoxy-manno-octulosonate cytidylyltransferase [Sandaracinaceae bacterium]|nr:3-deoxy-manno-octulosonate cytidylyltransferase [Sandaracinaceae bacterium]